MRRRIVSAALALALAASLTACGGGGTNADAGTKGQESNSEGSGSADGEKITLNLYWWGNQVRNDVTKKAADLYMEQNPNIEIKIEFTDWGGYWDKLSAMTAGGNMPDIIQQDYSYLRQYQESGSLADLTPFIEDGTIDVSDIPQSIIESGSIDGRCYALSLGSNANLMAYDKEAVEAAGVTMPEQPTYEDLIEIGQKVYEATGIPTTFDGGLNMIQMMAREDGSKIFDEWMAGESTTTAKYYQYLEDTRDLEWTIPPEILSEKDTGALETSPIVDASAWDNLMTSNMFIGLSAVTPRPLGLCMFPASEDMVEQPLFLKPSQFFSIAETSEYKKEAAEFVNWFTNSVECNEILLAERGIPVSTKVAEAIKPKVDETTQMVFDYIAKVGEIATPIDPPDPSGKGEIEAGQKLLSEEVRTGGVTAAEAAQSLTDQAKRILNN